MRRVFRLIILLGLTSVFAYQCYRSIVKLLKWDIGTVKTTKAVNKVRFPAMTICPFLDEPEGFSDNLTRHYSNLPGLDRLTYYGVQGLDPSSEDYMVHWDVGGRVFPGSPKVDQHGDVFFETISPVFSMVGVKGIQRCATFRPNKDVTVKSYNSVLHYFNESASTTLYIWLHNRGTYALTPL